jgi:hypothetical protein
MHASEAHARCLIGMLAMHAGCKHCHQYQTQAGLECSHYCAPGTCKMSESRLLLSELLEAATVFRPQPISEQRLLLKAAGELCCELP